MQNNKKKINDTIIIIRYLIFSSDPYLLVGEGQLEGLICIGKCLTAVRMAIIQPCQPIGTGRDIFMNLRLAGR